MAEHPENRSRQLSEQDSSFELKAIRVGSRVARSAFARVNVSRFGVIGKPLSVPDAL